MKKRTVISAVAGIALAGVMCVSFAACGNEAESMKGEEVTAEQWAAAFAAENFENVKIEMSSDSKEEMGEISAKMSMEGELIIADGKAYYKLKYETDGDLGDLAGELGGLKDVEQYEEQVEGDTVVYTKNADGAWVKDADDAYPIAFRMLAQYTGMASDYESYEYNADLKGYVEKGSSSDEQLIYKFKDGKLAAIWAEVDESEEAMGVTVSVKGSQSVVFTYGGQSVTLPTVA